MAYELAFPGNPAEFSGVTSFMQSSLARRVFALGDKPEAHQGQFLFHLRPGTEGVPRVGPAQADRPAHQPAWQVAFAEHAPASPRPAALFAALLAARAALAGGFIRAAERPIPPGRCIRSN